MRFNRLRDIGLTDQQILDNLVFSGGKVGDLMKIAMDPKDAAAWFGAAPPELSLIARSRSSPAGTSAKSASSERKCSGPCHTRCRYDHRRNVSSPHPLCRSRCTGHDS
jgi:cytochrome c1